MRHGHTLLGYTKVFVAFGAMALAGACADTTTTTPTVGGRAGFYKPANFNIVGEPVVFRVDNSQGAVQQLNNHLISIPAGAICDLETSGYGSTTWEQECEPLRGSVLITATIMEDDDGQPYVDFQPAMRFAPTKEVVLFLHQGKNSGKKQLRLEYCNNLGHCVDESLTDSSIKPFRISGTPLIGRRLKHFSGFLISAGDPCNGSIIDLGDNTFWCEEGGFGRRSGYMVASGEDVAVILKDKDEDDKSSKKEEQQ